MAFNLTPEELARFYAYIQQGGSLTSSAPNPAPNHCPSAFAAFHPTQVPSSESGPSATQPFPLQQTQVPSQAQSLAIQPVFQPTQFASSGSSVTQPLQVQTQPLMTQPPPVSQLYQNIRPHQLGHPATTTSRPSTSF